MAQDFQKDKQVIQKRLTDLQSRRGTLHTDRERLAESIEQQKRTLGESLLAGGQEPSAALDKIARDQQKLDALNEAIRQADEKIASDQFEIRELESKQRYSEFYQRVEVNTQIALQFIGELYTVVNRSGMVKAEYADLERTGGGISLQNLPDFDALTYKVFIALFDQTQNGLLNKVLQDMQSGYPQVIEKAKAKQGGR